MNTLLFYYMTILSFFSINNALQQKLHSQEISSGMLQTLIQQELTASTVAGLIDLLADGLDITNNKIPNQFASHEAYCFYILKLSLKKEFATHEIISLLLIQERTEDALKALVKVMPQLISYKDPATKTTILQLIKESTYDKIYVDAWSKTFSLS